MSLVLSCLILSFLLVLLLKFANLIISEYSSFNREELSAFECGFETHSLSRVPFSMRYFFITLVFLLFDLEIVLLVFSSSFIMSSSFVFSFIAIFFFILVLSMSLFYELIDGSLDWLS